ncbi:MAG: hypothetical protein H6981_11250 [Gammaproteobacteria bacterium]|nr:hypothetical protein [Gammaproteobacteria bacterium]
MRTSAILFSILVSTGFAAHAQPWEFGTPIPISATTDGKAFHHLESSGRRSLAVSGNRVGVTWEDDRDGTPRAYLGLKSVDQDGFRETLLTPDTEAFEPSIAALPDGRFVIAWEQDGQIFARTADGTPRQLSEHHGAQASLLGTPDGAVVVYAERPERFAQIRLRRITASTDGSLALSPACAIDPVIPIDEQLYPAAALSGDRLVVAWEDRRPKHTIIMAAMQTGECTFTTPQRVNIRPRTGAGSRTLPYGTGSGVSRVAIAAYADNKVFAAWADKRNFRHGYDIWGADLNPTSGQPGANQQVQDAFGELAPQWHTSVAGHPGGALLVAWDDGREGNADIMLSWREDGEWSDDLPLPGASGSGEQAHPSIVIDASGNLHVAWVERDDKNGPTRLRYLLGTRTR